MTKDRTVGIGGSLVVVLYSLLIITQCSGNIGSALVSITGITVLINPSSAQILTLPWKFAPDCPTLIDGEVAGPVNITLLRK